LQQHYIKKNNHGLNNFKNLISFFREKYTEITDDILELLVQKGVFPYEYLNSFERLNETEYPSFELFYDSLKEKNINEKIILEGKNYLITLNVKHSKNIWNYT
jgi:hypothetical protein